MWDHVELDTHQYGPNKGQKCLTVTPPVGGFGKSYQLGINNAIVITQRPKKTEDPNNPHCAIKLIFFYRSSQCNPEQNIFFCHVNKRKGEYIFKPNNPVRQNPISTWVNIFANLADFKDWDKYTAHDN